MLQSRIPRPPIKSLSFTGTCLSNEASKRQVEKLSPLIAYTGLTPQLTSAIICLLLLFRSPMSGKGFRPRKCKSTIRRSVLTTKVDFAQWQRIETVPRHATNDGAPFSLSPDKHNPKQQPKIKKYEQQHPIHDCRKNRNQLCPQGHGRT